MDEASALLLAESEKVITPEKGLICASSVPPAHRPTIYSETTRYAPSHL